MLSTTTGKISLRHSSGIMSRLDLANKENAEFAYKALNMYNVYKNSLEQSFEHLKTIKICEKELDDILAKVLLSEPNMKIYQETGNINHEDISTFGKNVFNKAKETIYSGIGQDLGETGTGLWLINGLTSYYQNEVNYKNDEYKFDSIQQGQASRKVQMAFDLLVA